MTELFFLFRAEMTGTVVLNLWQISHKLLSFSFMVYSKEIPYQSELLKKHYKDRMEMFAFQPLNQGDIVFVGDSITELGMSWAHRFDDLRVRNRGIKGDMTYGVLERLNEMINTPPKAIFIMIGVNDIFNYHYMREVKM